MLEAQSDQLQMWDGKNSKIWARVQTFLVMFCSAPAVARTAGAPFRPTNMFAPASTPAQSIFGLSIFVLAVTGAIFIVVFTLLADSVVEFRKPKNDDGREPPRSHGRNQVEVAWTVIPILIVVALFMATARVIADIQKAWALSISCPAVFWSKPAIVTGIAADSTNPPASLRLMPIRATTSMSPSAKWRRDSGPTWTSAFSKQAA